MDSVEADKDVKVLVADDEEHIVKFICYIMSSMGAVPFSAYDGEQAFTIYQREKPDIVFTDIYMPKLSGIILLQRLKRINEKQIVVLITGTSKTYQDFFTMGIKPDSFLRKPIDPRSVIELMLHYFPQLRQKPN